MAQGDRRDYEKKQAERLNKEKAGWEPKSSRRRNPAKGIPFGSGASSSPFGKKKPKEG